MAQQHSWLHSLTGLNVFRPQAPLRPGQFADDFKQMDTSETVRISALALLKMLKHARAGVPLEVMGLMLGEYVDLYTIVVVDVFAMPQSGTAVSVESVDPVYQTSMLEHLKQVGRPEMVVGWYHSHPGFGCFLSSVDQRTQTAFEQLHERAVALVIDPIQSVKGKFISNIFGGVYVMMDVFRTINTDQPMTVGRIGGGLQMQTESRMTTSNLGHLREPSAIALVSGLNKHYYSLDVKCRCQNHWEHKMLSYLGKPTWTAHLQLLNTTSHSQANRQRIQALLAQVKKYHKDLEETADLTRKEVELRAIGREHPRRRVNELAVEAMHDNITQSLLISIEAAVHQAQSRANRLCHQKTTN